MIYHGEEELRLCLILNRKNYYFSQDRLLHLSGLCQVYLEEYPETKEINLSDPTFDGDDLCLFFRFLDILDLPLNKEECLSLYQTAVYFCLIEKYMKILRDDITKYFIDKLNLVITFDQHGRYICQDITERVTNNIRTNFFDCVTDYDSSGLGVREVISKKQEKKNRKQAWRAERRANNNKSYYLR